jgi:hypothetical protein
MQRPERGEPRGLGGFPQESLRERFLMVFHTLLGPPGKFAKSLVWQGKVAVARAEIHCQKTPGPASREPSSPSQKLWPQS